MMYIIRYHLEFQNYKNGSITLVTCITFSLCTTWGIEEHLGKVTLTHVIFIHDRLHKPLSTFKIQIKHNVVDLLQMYMLLLQELKF